MCAAVEEVLLNEFGVKLGDEGVSVIDPCTGTGNFAVNLLRRAHERNPRHFERFYREQLFANEVMLMPYYIASLNIEHEYYALTGKYEGFEGICFVDTLDLAESDQMRMAFMTEKNTERVERQKKAPITVIIGNPPYNAGQVNENDNNKNRVYSVIDNHITDTYIKSSKATNRNSVYDAYIRFFRWATERLQERDGIVCFVSNNGFLDGIALDGFRKCLLQDFTQIYHLDLRGNARTSGERRKQEGGNVFDDKIRVGVGITVAIRSVQHRQHELFYQRVPSYWSKEEKLAYLVENVNQDGKHNSLNTVEWEKLTPDINHTWLVPENADEYTSFIPIGSKEAKAAKSSTAKALFKDYSGGIKTNRDSVVYDFESIPLIERVQQFIEDFNSEIDRYKRSGSPKDVDSFVKYDKVKWSRDLKLDLQRNNYAKYSETKIRHAIYRPYSKRYIFFDKILNQDILRFPLIFPNKVTENENRIIIVTDIGSEKPFMSLVTNQITDLHVVGAGSSCQCFPFYVYDEDGSNRRENITDWALGQFREKYEGGDENRAVREPPLQHAPITKWDIFYYVYGLLHHPGYREKFADNLKRELPRIPLAADFWGFSKAGRALADLHLNYETVKPYELEWVTTPGKSISYRVEKMKLTEVRPLIPVSYLSSGEAGHVQGEDNHGLAQGYKTYRAIQINDSLTLWGIPAEAFAYRLGNRSALEWVVDQYQVSEDKRSGIVSDPNGYSDDEHYIVNLVERVVQVSAETVKIVKEIAALGI